MGYSYNHGLVTANKGMGLVVCVITDLTEDDCTVDEDFGAGFVASVSNDSAGVYTVQLAAPYPPKLKVLPMLSVPDGTTDLRFARYETDSYDSEAGTFTVNIMDDDDSGAPALADPDATDELLLVMFPGRYTTI